jgi:hypothetical protein
MTQVFLSIADAATLGLCGGQVGFSKVVKTEPKSSAFATHPLASLFLTAVTSLAVVASLVQ